jgi:hypothetical protein
MANLTFILNADPRRRPRDWRWRLAVHLADHPDDDAAKAHADLWVVLALLLLRELRHDPAAVRPSPVRAAYGIYSAHQLSRWVVEAHLLTGDPLDQAARRCGVGRDVLGAYQQVFFEVRDPRQAAGDMLQQLMGATLCLGLSEGDQRALLILAAGRGLCELIDGLARHFRSAPLTAQDFAVSDPAAVDDLRGRLGVKLWVVRNTLPINEMMVQAADVLEAVEKRLALPAKGQEVNVGVAAARLQRANEWLDEVRACAASEMRRLRASLPG